jgi:hypothetical protein
MEYNMYHKRPLETQNARPADPPKAAEARGRPGAGCHRAWGSPGHFGGRYFFATVATTDPSLDASRLRDTDR